MLGFAAGLCPSTYTHVGLKSEPLICCVLMNGSFTCSAVIACIAGSLQSHRNMLREATHDFMPFPVGSGLGMASGLMAKACCRRLYDIYRAGRVSSGIEDDYGAVTAVHGLASPL